MKVDEVYAKLKKMIASVSVGIKSTSSTLNPDGSVTITINFTSGSPLSFTMSPVKGDKGTGIKDALIKEIQNGENTEYHLIFIDDKNNNIDAGKIPISSGEVYDDTQIKSDINDLKSDKQDKTDNSLDTTDKTVVGAINEVNGNQLDTVTFSADYKNIIINRKNGLNPYTIPISAIIHNAKLTELNDIDSTNIGDGKTLVYDGATQKHKYVDTTGTDELVKMDSTTDAKHLGELIDKSTIANDNGVLKVKKLDGQQVTIAEINYLKGLTMNVMDLVNAFANGGVKVLNTPVNTHADLSTLDRTQFIDGISYIVYVLADETHSGAKTTYLCDKTSETFFGNADSQRNFITNPIDLANEVTGKLGASNIDVDSLWNLLTINDTYNTLTTKDEVFGTHGAKALYDELVAEIGKKANATDLTTHTSDTNIHVTTADKEKWNKVTDKVDTADFNTHKNDTDIHITSAERTKWNEVDNKVNKTDIVDNLTSTDTDKPLSANQGKVLKGEVDLKANDDEVVKKTDITTTIDSSSTDTQVPSAKSVYDNAIKDKNLKTYTSFAQLGITDLSTSSLSDIGVKMGENSSLNVLITTGDMEEIAYNAGIIPINDVGILSCVRLAGRFKATFSIDMGGTGKYISEYMTFTHNILTQSTFVWKKVCTTSVADVEKTNITSRLVNATGGEVVYSVKNGMCYVRFSGVTTTTTSTGKYILSPGTLPTMDNSLSNGHYPVADGNSTNGLVVVDSDTCGVRYYGGAMGMFTTISYPVKES